MRWKAWMYLIVVFVVAFVYSLVLFNPAENFGVGHLMNENVFLVLVMLDFLLILTLGTWMFFYIVNKRTKYNNRKIQKEDRLNNLTGSEEKVDTLINSQQYPQGETEMTNPNKPENTPTSQTQFSNTKRDQTKRRLFKMFSRKPEQWELFRAIRNKDLNEMSKLIRRGVNITEGNTTPATSSFGEYENARKLYSKRGIDLAEMKNGETPLIFATRKEYFQGISVLIGSGADINGRDKAGRTALWWAAGLGNIDIAQFLITKGASLKCTSECMPLLHAVEIGHLKIAELLVRSGADIDKENALYWAMVMDKLEIAELLLKNGADISCVAETDLRKLSGWAAANDKLDLVVLLIQKGVPVNLAAASQKGHLRIVTALLNSTAAVDKGSALLVASAAGHFEIVKALLDTGADVNIVSDTKLDDWGVSYGTGGQTPLMRAAENGHHTIVQLLIERGANLNARDEMGYTALTLATRFHHYLEVVRILLNSGADINIATYDSFYDQTSSHFGWTALMFAANIGDADIVRLLIEKGAILNARDKNGNTAIYHAQGEAKEVLEKAGA